MKKFYLTLATMLLALSSQAKQLNFFMGDGSAIADESTVYFNNVEVDSYEGGMDVVMNPGITLQSDVTADNIVVMAECSSGQKIQLCAGGACEIGTSITKTNVKIEAGQKLPVLFEYMGMGLAPDTEIPTIEATLVAMYEGDDESMRSFTILMGKDVGGVVAIETSRSLRCVPGSIEYDLPEAALLSVYDTEGHLVINENISGRGSVATSGLLSGVYVYTLGKEKGKIYVK